MANLNHEETINDDFGSRLEAELRRQDRSHKWLGRQVGISGAGVSKWVKGGGYPTFTNLLIVLRVLDMDANYLLFGDVRQKRMQEGSKGAYLQEDVKNDGMPFARYKNATGAFKPNVYKMKKTNGEYELVPTDEVSPFAVERDFAAQKAPPDLGEVITWKKSAEPDARRYRRDTLCFVRLTGGRFLDAADYLVRVAATEDIYEATGRPDGTMLLRDYKGGEAFTVDAPSGRVDSEHVEVFGRVICGMVIY